MKNEITGSNHSDDLRFKAEECLKDSQNSPASSKIVDGIDATALVHELQVHQIELEMQNEELKGAKLEMEDALVKYSDLYDFAPIGLFALDAQGLIQEVNLVGAALLGAERCNLMKRLFRRFVAPKDRPFFDSFCKSAYETSVKQTCELYLLREGVPTVYARIEGIAEKDDSLKGRQCRIAVLDITDRKWMEEEIHKRTAELEKAKEAAETASAAKAAFLANVSHELRTPMNAVIGFSSLLLDESFTPDQKEYIEGIRTGGEALLTLINDILDFSKLEVDKVELACQPFSLKHLIDESLNLVSVQANKKGLNLYCAINYDTPDTIIGDPGKLRQILVNLLTNAVKYIDEGDICLSISSKIVQDNLREILFNVMDNGIGIPKDKISELFRPFTQLEKTTSSKREGVGLGLAITKNLVELMGGTIWAESVPGQGTVFHVMIQAETLPGIQIDLEETGSDAAIENLSELKPMRILVAEDNPSNQKVLVEMLKRLDYRPDIVADGLKVIQAFERQNYDLILMDIRMPEINGLTATKVIRKLLPKNGPKIVAITAYALEGDREKYLEAGMDDYIAKPVKIEELAEVLKRCALKIQQEEEAEVLGHER